MYVSITRLLNEAATDDRVKVTVFTGAGDYYSSGNDIVSAIMDLGDESKRTEDKTAAVQNLVSAFIDYPKLLAAAVNGPAIGIAATKLGLFDVVYASDKAFFYTPFTKLGLVAEGCSSYTFPRIMGMRKASEMLLFGHKMYAQEAKDYGFVTEVFPHATFEQEVWPKIEQFTQFPKQSMMASRRLMRDMIKEDLHKANKEECKQLRIQMNSEESFNAAMAFMNRNKL
ncbi:enoyl-CoA delta isomerase 2-like isoform X2 [Periplaneta americana]